MKGRLDESSSVGNSAAWFKLGYIYKTLKEDLNSLSDETGGTVSALEFGARLADVLHSETNGERVGVTNHVPALRRTPRTGRGTVEQVAMVSDSRSSDAQALTKPECPVCHRVLSSFWYMAKHVKDQHPEYTKEIPMPPPKNNGVRDMKCPRCGVLFNKIGLPAHIRHIHPEYYEKYKTTTKKAASRKRPLNQTRRMQPWN